MAKRRITVTVDEDVYQTALRAVEAGRDDAARPGSSCGRACRPPPPTRRVKLVLDAGAFVALERGDPLASDRGDIDRLVEAAGLDADVVPV